MVYEERDIRSSAEALVRRRIVTPVIADAEVDKEGGGGGGDVEQQQEPQAEEDQCLEEFLQFQGCLCVNFPSHE